MGCLKRPCRNKANMEGNDLEVRNFDIRIRIIVFLAYFENCFYCRFLPLHIGGLSDDNVDVCLFVCLFALKNKTLQRPMLTCFCGYPWPQPSLLCRGSKRHGESERRRKMCFDLLVFTSSLTFQRKSSNTFRTSGEGSQSLQLIKNIHYN